MPDASVDSVVTDPPYGLGKEPDAREVLTAWLDGEEFQPGGAGFMGRAWDAFVPSPLVWAECLRVLKPGGHLVAFGGSRTYDWIVMGVRLAGFEVRDQLFWMYGSGFPKSLDISKAIDKAAGIWRGRAGAVKPETVGQAAKGAEYERTSKGRPVTDDARQWEGWGTALKPAHEPIVFARKPLSGTVAANVLEHGTGAINVDGCRVESDGSHMVKGVVTKRTTVSGDDRKGAALGMYGAGASFTPTNHEGGRWPANILHDGSPEVLAVFPETTSGNLSQGHAQGSGMFGRVGGDVIAGNYGGDTGSAARFFYSAKASRAERELGLADFAPETVGDGRKKSIDNAYQRGKTARRNAHPTVKPVAVMRWLVRLVTPPGGTVLDPYSGSGTTGVAAALEGFGFIGCELSPEYVEIARARIAHARKFPAMWEPGYVAPDEVPEEQLDLFGS
jgi:site-specific DNA-methyltransferase (adenine-specific)